MTLVSGKVLVTGATGGLGHAIARAFGARGAQLTLSGRRADVLAPLATELGALALDCDLGDRDAVGRLSAAAGEVDVLVLNAALPASGELTDLTQDQIDTMLEVNLRAPIAIARAVAPAMVQRGRGHMVFVSSLSGLYAGRSSSMYSATKFGLRGFALGLREDLRGANVGVSVVLPGFIRDAGMFADAGVKLPFGVGTRTPQDVSSAVLRAVEHNRAEIAVAPPSLRWGASFAGFAPGIAAQFTRRFGSDKIAMNMAAAQVDKRP